MIGIARLAIVILAAAQLCDATSQRAPPLRRLHTPRDATIRLLRRDAQHATTVSLARRSDSFNLTAASLPRPDPVRWHDEIRHDDSLFVRFIVNDRPVSLVLSPTPDLLAPDARVHYHSIDGSVRTEALRREDVRAYSGHVVREHHAAQWWAETLAGLIRDGAADDDAHGRSAGWARLTLRPEDGAWSGAFTLDGNVHHVAPTDTYLLNKLDADPHPDQAVFAPNRQPGSNTVIFTDEDTVMPSHSCLHDTLDFNAGSALRVDAAALSRSPSQSLFDSILGPNLVKRQNGGDIAGGNVSTNYASSIGSTVGCPKDRRVVFIGVAADCTYTNRYGNSSQATQQILTNINSASALYLSTFNVSLGVVELSVQDPVCPSTANSSVPWNVGCAESGNGVDLNSRLSLFSQWRGAKGGSDGAGLWHLMTNCSSGSEVGVAWLSQLCVVTASGSSGDVTSGTGVTAAGRNEWQVVAHEIGHNFGAIHDCSSTCTSGSSCCPLSTSTCDAASNYIMSPVSTKSVSNFSCVITPCRKSDAHSPCSVGNICTTLNSGLNTSCLAVPGQRSVISTQQCGNGIVEPGEDCDPGSAGSSCCTSKCKFATGAVCDPENSACCTSSCQLASTSTVCRPAVDSRCDTAETCDGKSASCPADQHISDGTSCASGGLTCMGGICSSRDLQCQTQGASLSIKSACSLQNSPSCQVTCASPSSSDSCVQLDSNFIDGTPCGYAGTCSNGACNNGSGLSAAKSWYSQNLGIAIPVTVAAALLVIALLGCLLRCCCRRQKAAKTPPSAAYVHRAPPPPAMAYVAAPSPARRSGGRPSSSTRELIPPPQHHSGGIYSPPQSARSISDAGFAGIGAGGVGQQQQRSTYAPPSPHRSTYAPPTYPPPNDDRTSSWVDPTHWNGSATRY